MARHRRLGPKSVPQHVIQRGNNRKKYALRPTKTILRIFTGLKNTVNNMLWRFMHGS